MKRESVSPGSRIKMLRIILNMSREDFCIKHKINFNTLTSIEIDRLKLSSKQLNKLIEAFESEGIYVESAWIMEAKGRAPTRFFSEVLQKQGRFLEDWAHFFSENRNTVIFQIAGSAMEPFYFAGDLVGGLWGLTPEALIEKRCIVQWENALHVGRLCQGGEGFYLAPSNPRMAEQVLSFRSPPAKIAEILWHLHKNSHPIPELSSLEAYKP